jgi:signal transduction histidine kinase
VLARGTEPIGRVLEVLGWGLACAGAVMAAGAAAAVWAAVGRGLRPLRGVAEQAGRIDAASLSARFGADVPAELRPIVGTLNELLARLEAAFARERRFTAAAAHELRTPIAELRAMAEVALRWPDEKPQQGMAEVLAVAKNMEALATSLLALSRCESGLERAGREPVDLDATVRRAWDAVARRAAERGVSLTVRGAGETSVVLADAAMVEAIARNLLENAAAYAPAGAEIDCRVGGGCLAVTNPQEGLSAADLANLFEPFWRKDTARATSDGGAHAGLGLSLVKAYAASMGARVRAELTAENAFRVTLTFAAADVIVPSSSDATIPANSVR